LVGTGDLCANIYVFNDQQEMQECCSCPLTANSLRTISVISDLTSKPANPTESLSAGVIKIVGSAPGVCSSSPGSVTAATFAPATVAEGLHAWINHTETMASNQAGFKPTPWGFITSTSVEEFAHSALDSGELAYLRSGCAEINSLTLLSEHPGICNCGDPPPPPLRQPPRRPAPKPRPRRRLQLRRPPQLRRQLRPQPRRQLRPQPPRRRLRRPALQTVTFARLMGIAARVFAGREIWVCNAAVNAL